MQDTSEYKKVLKLLKKDESIFIGFIKMVPPINAEQIKSIDNYSKSFNDRPKVQELIEPFVTKQVENALNKKKGSWGAFGKELPRLLKAYEGLLSDKVKDKVLNKMLTPMKEFYAYSKKDLLKIAIPWVKDEELALKIVQLHHRSLDTNTIDHLLSKITNGINHDGLKKFKDTSLPFVARKLEALDLGNMDDRHTFINSVARTPSILKLTNSVDITLTLDDLKKLPPARRFNFLVYLYEPVIGKQYNGRYYNTITKGRITAAIKKYGGPTQIPTDNISKDEVKNLLFSVSIRKNDVVSAWWNRYEKYLNKRNGK